MTAGEKTSTGERADLVASLDRHRYFLRNTVRGLIDEQGAQRTTVSELTLGGLIKHVTATEQQWVRFIQEGPSVMAFDYRDEAAMAAYANTFRMLPGETLAGHPGRVREGRGPDRRAGRGAAGPGCRAAAARGAVVRAGRHLVGAAGLPAHHRRDRPACRACRHHP